MKPICITCKTDCHNAGTTTKIVDCSQYKPGRILTNADRIRSMSDEELSDWAILAPAASGGGTLMDVEKLIEQLNGYFEGKKLRRGAALDAATALATLQAENEKLRGEVEGMRSNWYKAGEGVKKLRDKLEQARAEITRLKHYEDKCHDCPIVCAKTEIIKAHEELETVQAELEQAKRERDAAVEDLHKLCPAWKWDDQKEG